MIEIVIPIVLGVITLTLLVMIVFGIRSLSHGRIKFMTMAAIAVPFLLLIGLGFGLGDWPRAGVVTIMITLVGALIAMVLSSFKGLFT